MSNASTAWRARAATLAIAAILPLTAQAQVYKCPRVGGSISYQSTPCATDSAPTARPTAAQLNATRRAQLAADASAENKPYVDAYANPAPSRPQAPGPLKPSVAAPPRDGHVTSDDERRRACTIALNNQAVLGRGHAAYSFDKDGNKNVVQAGDRPQLKAEADHVASATCQ